MKRLLATIIAVALAAGQSIAQDKPCPATNDLSDAGSSQGYDLLKAEPRSLLRRNNYTEKRRAECENANKTRASFTNRICAVDLVLGEVLPDELKSSKQKKEIGYSCSRALTAPFLGCYQNASVSMNVEDQIYAICLTATNIAMASDLMSYYDRTVAWIDSLGVDEYRKINRGNEIVLSQLRQYRLSQHPPWSTTCRSRFFGNVDAWFEWTDKEERYHIEVSVVHKEVDFTLRLSLVDRKLEAVAAVLAQGGKADSTEAQTALAKVRPKFPSIYYWLNPPKGSPLSKYKSKKDEENTIRYEIMVSPDGSSRKRIDDSYHELSVTNVFDTVGGYCLSSPSNDVFRWETKFENDSREWCTNLTSFPYGFTKMSRNDPWCPKVEKAAKKLYAKMKVAPDVRSGIFDVELSRQDKVDGSEEAIRRSLQNAYRARGELLKDMGLEHLNAGLPFYSRYQRGDSTIDGKCVPECRVFSVIQCSNTVIVVSSDVLIRGKQSVPPGSKEKNRPCKCWVNTGMQIMDNGLIRGNRWNPPMLYH